MAMVASLRKAKTDAEGKFEIAKDMLLDTVNRVHQLEATVARLEKQLVIDQRFALERIDCRDHDSCSDCPASLNEELCENAKKTTA
jgi:hypothetical protein